MRTEYIPKIPVAGYDNHAPTIFIARKLMPWAYVVIAVDNGFKGFESRSDYTTWLNQV